MTQSVYAHELDVAMRLAREAGEIIKAFYDVPPTVRWKDPTEPVTEADRAVNAYLVKQFGQAFPADGMLAEESKDDLSRLEKRRVWIVDPMDGTAEFIAHNGEFCIMIGLAVDGAPVVGVVYQPIDDVLYAAALGAGAFVEEFGDHTPLHVSDVENIEDFRLVVSRSHRVPITDAIIRGFRLEARTQHRQRGPEDRADRARPGGALHPPQRGHQGVGHVRAGYDRAGGRRPDDGLLEPAVAL